MPSSADEPRYAIYCRISRDREGAGLGIERQLLDCQALATQLGGTVVATFADNDISAYSGKRRPGYEALLATMRDGTITTVLAWHADRIHRSMVELEDYVAASDLHGIATQTVRAGLIDLSTPSGRLVARQLGAVARYEVEHAIERQRAAKLQAARAGLPSGGNRPYGYEQNGMVPRPQEAAVVVEAAERFVSGDSYRSIALNLNERGIPTAKGHKWTAINVRNVVLRKRNIAIRTHNDDEYPAQWPPLFTDKLWNELQLAVARGKLLYGDHSYSRIHLLKGFVFCGICNNRLNIISTQNRDGSYVPAFSCRKFDDVRGEVGCGGIKRRKPPVEDLVVEAIMYRLDSEDLSSHIRSAGGESSTLAKLVLEREKQVNRLTEILNLYSTGELEFSDFKIAKTVATERREQISKQINAAWSQSTLANIPPGKTIQEAWESSDLPWKRQLVDTVIDKIFLDPRVPGKKLTRYKEWWFDPELVRIQWKA